MDAEVIKYLWEMGLPKKAICIITGCRQPYVSKVCGGKLRLQNEGKASFSAAQFIKYGVVQNLLHLDPILDSQEQMVRHIHLLRYLGYTSDRIYDEFYNFLSRRKFDYYFQLKGIMPAQFDYEKYSGGDAAEFALIFDF